MTWHEQFSTKPADFDHYVLYFFFNFGLNFGRAFPITKEAFCYAFLEKNIQEKHFFMENQICNKKNPDFWIKWPVSELNKNNANIFLKKNKNSIKISPEIWRLDHWFLKYSE